MEKTEPFMKTLPFQSKSCLLLARGTADPSRMPPQPFRWLVTASGMTHFNTNLCCLCIAPREANTHLAQSSHSPLWNLKGSGLDMEPFISVLSWYLFLWNCNSVKFTFESVFLKSFLEGATFVVVSHTWINYVNFTVNSVLQNPSDLAHALCPEISTVVHHLKDEWNKFVVKLSELTFTLVSPCFLSQTSMFLHLELSALLIKSASGCTVSGTPSKGLEWFLCGIWEWKANFA